jgi:CHAT domain/SIR2-like domain
VQADIHELSFKLIPDESGSGYKVHLDAGTFGSADGVFQLDLSEGRRIRDVLNAIQQGSSNELDTIRDVGDQLLNGLLANEEVRGVFNKARNAVPKSDISSLRLSLPGDLLDIPWEMLYEPGKEKFFSCHPSFCIERDPPEDLEHYERDPIRVFPVKLLVVVPGGSGLSTDLELTNLELAAEHLKGLVELEKLTDSVSVTQLAKVVESRDWDIVHFIGHGEVDKGKNVFVRMNAENTPRSEDWVEGEVFASVFQKKPPQLVVLNCCLGGTTSPHRTLSGLGPSLLAVGVPRVVAMRYEIPDDLAVKFSEVFYTRLFSEPKRGRVDHAMTEARRGVYLSQRERVRAFATPVFFQMPGHECMFDTQAVEPKVAPAAATPAAQARPRIELTSALVDTMRDGQCLLFTGSGLLGLGAMRSGSPALGPMDLAAELAGESSYPANRYPAGVPELSLPVTLPRVCQFYEKVKQRRHLIQRVVTTYQGLVPGQAIRDIASWNVAAIFHSYYDSLIEDAIRVQRFELLRTLDKGPGERVPPFVYLRGSIKLEQSLVLTDQDQDEQIDRIASMPSQLGDLLTRGIGMSVLFLGVSPADPLVRRVTARLLQPVSKKNRGTMFFCTPAGTEDMYWDQWDVEWLNVDMESLIAELQSSLRGPQ